MPNTPDWLTARPIAHRGLHDAANGIIENTIAACDGAIARGFAIELDVQPTVDGDVVVFHDHVLDRLTPKNGAVSGLSREDLTSIPITGSGETIPSLAQVLAHVDGRAPLVLELKSRFDGRVAVADAVAGAVGAYKGPLAIMSFDPVLMSRVRRHNTGRPLGVVAAAMGYQHWGALSLWKRFTHGALLHGPGFWCDFISYDQNSLPAVSPMLAKWLGKKALVTWTVKDQKTANRVSRYVDAITFEGFDPHAYTGGA